MARRYDGGAVTESDREWKGRRERESDGEWMGDVRGRLSDREWRTMRVKMLNEFQFLKKFLLETESLFPSGTHTDSYFHVDGHVT